MFADFRTSTDGDIDLTGQTMVLVEGHRAVAQGLLASFLTHRGEWKLDTAFGMPYRAFMEGRVSVSVASAYIKDHILDQQHITGLKAFTATMLAGRRLSVAFQATTDEGVVEAEAAGPMHHGTMLLLFRPRTPIWGT